MARLRTLSLVALALLLLVGLTVACSKPAPTTTPAPTTQAPSPTPTPTAKPTATPTPTPAPTATPTPTAQAPLTFKVTFSTPEAAGVSQGASWTLREVEKRSGGRVKFQYYWMGSLLPTKDTVSGMEKNIADVGFVNPRYDPSATPLSTVALLPAIIDDMWPSLKAFDDLMATPELTAELAKHNLVYLNAWGVSSYGIFAKDPIKSLADIKGMKLQAGGEQADLAYALGAVPVEIISTEIYTALERGTVKASFFSPTGAKTYGWQAIAKYYFALPTGAQSMPMVMTKDAWNKLPADIQKMFVDLRDEQNKFMHQVYQGADEKILADFKATAGLTVFPASAADIKTMKDVALTTVLAKWVDKMKGQGLAGQKVLDTFRQLGDKYAPLNPFKK